MPGLPPPRVYAYDSTDPKKRERQRQINVMIGRQKHCSNYGLVDDLVGG